MIIEKRKLNAYEEFKLGQEIRRINSAPETYFQSILIIVFSLITVISFFHIYYYEDSSQVYVSKIMVAVCPVLVWGILDAKLRNTKERRKALEQVTTVGINSEVYVMRVFVKRAIAFEQITNEGTHYLIEADNGGCMYFSVDDSLVSAQINFPAEQIELYTDERFVWATSCKVNCYGRKVKPVYISAQRKWEFFENGFPADFEKEYKSFDEIIASLEMLVDDPATSNQPTS